ncbi:hypothetical protein EAO79_13620 [Plantibacter sp. PA-3-X8]|uniref:hypothetical protein n=1 Tax=Plantibacter sp. PA-3-X8 TaxID=2480625 RepID=UPI000F5FF790|nr:hypothetical protein [Plantibacter sp. PA-3-X8]AZH83817.1 hypothetical protein EAO79_13620 [Plantibacter sp. PA-3-X8]
MSDRPASPPIRIGEAEWIVMREVPDRPAGLVKYFAPSGAPAYFRCVTWAPRSEDRRLIGRFATLAEAERAVPGGRRSAAPATPRSADAWERGQAPWDAAPRRSDRYA